MPTPGKIITLLILPILLTSPVTAQRKPQPVIQPTYQRTTANNITLHLVAFDSRQYALQVADQPAGPGSIYPDAKTAAAKHNALAAINAGFFTPEGKPLGILIQNGKTRGYLNKSSLGTGIYYFSKKLKLSAIARRSGYQNIIKNANPDHLLQAGPMLAHNGEPVPGLSNSRSRTRSFIAHDGDNHWIIGYAQNATLAQLSKAIAGKTLAGVKITNGLNLDGGRSSDLYISSKIKNGPETLRGFFNKPVRNYLILKPL